MKYWSTGVPGGARHCGQNTVGQAQVLTLQSTWSTWSTGVLEYWITGVLEYPKVKDTVASIQGKGTCTGSTEYLEYLVYLDYLD